MKKAVVLEIKEEYAAVLTDEGLVQKIRNNNYAVGQEIDLTKRLSVDPGNVRNAAPRFRRWYRAAAAAAAILFISGGGLFYAKENAFAYSMVTITTEDTALELTLNKKDEVVAVKALDDESETAAQNLQVSVRRRKPLSDTLTEITEGLDTAEVSVSSRSEDHRQKLEEKVSEMLPPAQRLPRKDEAQPEQKTAPEGIEQPGQMTAPERIEQPEQMTAPEGMGQPEQKTAPEGIAQPEQKTAPERIEQPEQKTAPEGIAQPEQKTAPEGIEQPEQKTAPEGIAQPEQMTAPERIAQPEQMTAPGGENPAWSGPAAPPDGGPPMDSSEL